MSDYGPAIFIARKNKNEIDENEQSVLLDFVKKIVEELSIVDELEEPAEPEFYDYGEYEEKAVSFSIYSSISYDSMPEDMQEDLVSEFGEEDGAAIFKKIESAFPGTYTFQTYFVEL